MAPFQGHRSSAAAARCPACGGRSSYRSSSPSHGAGTVVGGNQKSNWATSPGRYVVREAGSGGRYTGRNSATLPFRIVWPRSPADPFGDHCGRHPRYSRNSSRIRGSTTSTADPFDARRYLDGAVDANSASTVFFERPITRAIALIGIRSARCSRRISAQSSTCNIRFLLTSTRSSGSGKG